MQHTSHNQLEALSERQTSLAKADHYSHMPTVKILRLGGERLPPSKKKKKKKSFGSLPLPQSGFATTIMVFFAHLIFAHLLIAEGPHVTQIL